jgi:integrase/recombinase XerD
MQGRDIMTTALVPQRRGDLATADIMEDFGKFLRLHTADGDASPATLRSYYGNAGQFVAWCGERGINPATATEDDIATYRRELVARYEVGTVAVKLAAVRRLYEAAVWRGLRQDNPAAGLKAPRDKTERAERVKFLPLDGLRRILDAPKGDNPAAVRDRAMLALMGRHGLRVSEVAGLKVDAVDLDAGTVRVVGKGRKSRTVYLIESPAEALRQWLDVRQSVANPGEPALFVSLDRAHRGGGMSTRAIRYVVDNHLADVGLKAKGISCHSLRHSAATWARAGGAKLDAIADQLGHSSTDTTRIYSKIVNKMQENPARYLEAMLTAQATV